MTKRHVHLYLPLRQTTDRRRRSSRDAGQPVEAYKGIQIIRKGGAGVQEPYQFVVRGTGYAAEKLSHAKLRIDQLLAVKDALSGGLEELVRHHAAGETTPERMDSLLSKWDATPQNHRRMMALFHSERAKKKSVDAPYGSKARTMSSSALRSAWQDPGGDEVAAGNALSELVRRGLDPKTLRSVGVEAAKAVAASIGEWAGS